MRAEQTEQEIVDTTFLKKWQAYRHFLLITWRANRGLAFFRIVLIVVNAVVRPVCVYLFALFIAAMTAGESERAPLLMGAVVVAYAVHALVTNLRQSKMDDWFSKSTALASQAAIFDHLTRLDPEQLLDKMVARDLDFVREDLWRLNNLSNHTERALLSVLSLVSAIGLALAAPWWVAVLILAQAAFEAFLHGKESRNDLWTSAWNSLDGRRIEYTRYVFLSGEEFRELRLLDATTRFMKKLKESSGRIVERFRWAAFISARQRIVLAMVHALAYGIVIVVLGREAFASTAALATLYVAVNLFSLMGDALSGLSSSMGYLYADMGILSRVHHLLDLPTESDRGVRLPKERLTIRFENVSFRYPGANHDALHDVSLTIQEGEHLAIVGENGAGKSTFLRLLSGLDHPTSGRILVNGKPLDVYRKREWRRAFHLMLQGAKLYQDFIADNLSYGEPPTAWKKTALSFEQSVEIAGADSVIREVPSGLDTFLGDWAAPPGIQPHRVSGGQGQRLLIARTLIHGGRIIGFDEPTSAMDARAEANFFERLHESMQGRGLIFISHRFSTVRRASRILVFHQGQLIEEGGHGELLLREGEYAKLYQEQAKWYA